MASLSQHLRTSVCRISLLHGLRNRAIGSTFQKSVTRRLGCSANVLAKKETVTINYILPDQEKVSVKAKEGQNLLDIALDNDLDIDGYGACEGTLACSTCHLVFEKETFEKLPESPTDEELDMLDLAYGLTDTSRLGCQICVTKDMDGLTVSVPESVSDARTV